MRVLALNSGSSSIKSALVDTERRKTLLDIRVESIGTAACRAVIDDVEKQSLPDMDFDAAVSFVLSELRNRERASGVPERIAHRVVHGGDRFIEPVVIDDGTLAAIEALNPLAPLHNPPALAAVRLARSRYPSVPHLAIFDTAFHATLPPQAREYALPRDVSSRHGIRRFGFHGISHGYVMESVAAHLSAKPQQLRIVSCHLGNGASVAAIEHGRSVETSMGMTPLEGLVMGTRAGDIDPGALLHLLSSRAFDKDSLDSLLNRQSGLMGLTGTNDMREIERRADAGNEVCRLAVSVYSHRVRKYIGAYAAVMGGVEAIAFTAGVGENSALIRQRCLEQLQFIGADLDEGRNRTARASATQPCIEISADASPVRLFVVRADEEQAMADEVARLSLPQDARDPARP